MWFVEWSIEGAEGTAESRLLDTHAEAESFADETTQLLELVGVATERVHVEILSSDPFEVDDARVWS